MRFKAIVCSLFASLLIPTDASAFFFFFIPGSAIQAVSDAITGSKGENCVGQIAKVGDRISLPDGSVGTVKSLSGTSVRCSNPLLPIRALIEVSSDKTPAVARTIETPPPPNITTKAGINLPDGWEALFVSGYEKANGVMFNAINRATETRLTLYAFSRDGVTDLMTFATAKREWQAEFFKNTKVTEVTPIVVNGVSAFRYEVTGVAYDNNRYTYLHTILETQSEILLLSTWTESAVYEAQRSAMARLADGLTGFSPPTPVAAIPAQVTPTIPNPPVENSKSDVVTGTSSPPSQIAPAASNAAQRLRELNAIYKEGLITPKEYEQKKKAILDSF